MNRSSRGFQPFFRGSHTRLAFVAAAVFAAALPALSAAQEELALGSRLRVTLSDQKHPLVGTFVRRTADSLTLEMPARSWNGVGQHPSELVSLLVAGATLVMGGIGAGVGLVVGGLSHSERWEVTTLPNLPPAPEVPTTAGSIPLVTSRF